METGTKLIFTAFVILTGTAIYFVDPKANNAGPNWLWRLGENDAVRNLMCRPDGTLRKYTKIGILVWFAIFLIIIWILPIE